MLVLELFLPLFSKIQRLKSDLESNSDTDTESLQNEWIQVIEETKVNLTKQQFSSEEIEKAIFPIVSLVDDIILSSSWEDKKQWSKGTLQMRLFETRSAGEIFYEYLNSLTTYLETHKHIRLIYLICLQLGFKGKFFRKEDQAKLHEVTQVNFAIIDSDLKLSEFESTSSTFTEAYIKGKQGNGIISQFDFKPIMIGIPFLTFITLFYIFKAEIIQLTAKLLTTI